MFRRTLKVATFALALAALSACVTQIKAAEVYSVAPEEVAQITTSGMGAIVVDIGHEQTCDAMSVRYRNLSDGSVVSKILTSAFVKSVGDVGAGKFASVMPVPPGRYMFIGGRCIYTEYGYSVTTTYTRNLDLIALYMKPFEVKAGQLVYTGTPNGERVSHEFGIALTDHEKFSGRKDRSSDHYTLYEVQDQTDRVRKDLENFNPQLASRLVNAVTPARLDKEVIRKIIAAAYAAEAGEVAPDDAAAARNRKAAQAKVKKDLGDYVLSILGSEFDDEMKPSLEGLSTQA